jgi:O-antigen/teichoic acid export membrane protein
MRSYVTHSCDGFLWCLYVKIAYLLAVISNRIVSLLALLLLSYILDQTAFGSYALMMINALLLHSLAGSWLSMATTRQLAALGVKDQTTSKSRAVVAAAYIILFEVALALLLILLHAFTGLGIAFEHVIAVLSLAIGLLLFDVAAAANNALGQDREYLRSNIVRNVGGNLFSLLAALIGAAAPIIIAGQTAGILLALAASKSTWNHWKSAIAQARQSGFRTTYLSEMFLFGIAGTLALGLLVFINGLIRNFVLLTDGAAVSGVFALTSDLFNAPLVLLGTAYSLSKMRELYQSAGLPQPEQIRLHRQFIATICFMTIPYAVGGYFAAPAIANLILPEESLALGRAIAGLSAAQSAALTIVSTSATILLTSGKKRKTVAVVLLTLLCLFISCMAAWSLGGGVYYAWATFGGSLVACLISIIAIGFESIPWKNLRSIVLGTVPMGCAVGLLPQSDHPFWPLLIVGVGVSVYAATNFLLGNKEWRELVPTKA